MADAHYISGLLKADRDISGKDVPQEDCASVIDGLCAVVADRDAVIAEKDAAMERMNQRLLWLERKVFGRSSERLRPEDPNQLHIDFGEDVVLPLSDGELDATEERVRETKADVHGEAERRRAAKRSSQSRKGETYRIGPEVPRMEPVRFYPDGYSPEKMTVIGWNRHEYLEIEGPKAVVRVEMEAICKPAGSKPTDASTPIFEARGPEDPRIHRHALRTRGQPKGRQSRP